MSSDMGVDAHRNPDHLGLRRGRDAHELLMTPSVPQQSDDIFVSHLDTPEAGTHNLDFSDPPRHEDTSYVA